MSTSTTYQGLSDAQVQAKMAAGEHNLPPKPLTRSVKQIIQQNTLTLFNLVNVVLGVLIITTGSYKNLLFLGVAIINTAIGTIQEIRAKRQIDKMSILAATQVNAWRAGQLVAIDQDQIVLGDVLQFARGDQLPVDGKVLATNGGEVDESPLTGEAKPVQKRAGDQLLSGSYLVAGQVVMQVTAVGEATFAAKLAMEAKSEKAHPSQLLTTINRIIKVLTYVLIPLGIALFAVSMLRRGDYNRAILTTSAAMIGMIPEGLVLLTNVALAVSARNLGKKRVLVRALPAIEALARVDVICLDKTGTITSGNLKVAEVHGEATLTVAAQLAYALNDDNETALAIKQAHPAQPAGNVGATVPFSSARKWSGATIDGHHYLMGAPEFTFGQALDPATAQAIGQATKAGFRVLVVAESQAPLTQPLEQLQLIGWLTIADEVRETAPATFTFFKKQGVTLKVISGDNPITVANVATRAGIEHAEAAIDMSTVGATPDFGKLASTYTVFGRVTPDQKQALIAALQAQQHTVAMTGDGVNDVLALRQSDCGIAMASGAEAAKSIAEFVLLDSNFDAMTGVLNEGRRVINNIERVASMYLVKTIYSVILAAIFLFVAADYPITPINLTPVTAVAVAIPSFFLTLEANFNRVTGQFMQKVMTIAAPGALAIVGYAVGLTFLGRFLNWPFETVSTLTVFMIGVICFHVLLLVAHPFNRYKLAMLAVLFTAFFGIFFVVNPVFSLANLWDFKLFLVYGSLVASTLPVYYGLQEFLGKRLLSKINWK